MFSKVFCSSGYFLKGFCFTVLSYSWFFGWREKAFLVCTCGYCQVLTSTAHTLGYAREKEKSGNSSPGWLQELIPPAILPPWSPHFLVFLSRFCRWCPGFLVVLNGSKENLCSLHIPRNGRPVPHGDIIFSFLFMRNHYFQILYNH